MSNIRFKFDESKLVHALAYFSLKGVPNLTKLKAAKLLYFADKMHLNRYGRLITGDNYVCMEHGPVPSNSLNEMDYALENDPEIREETPAILAVLSATKDRYPEFFLNDKRLFNPDVFSASDIEVLDETIRLHGSKTAWELREESHNEMSWKSADKFRASGSSFPIDFEAMFDQGNRNMLEFVLESQREEDEFDAAIDAASTTIVA